jgi:hypothetical protein
VNTSFIGTLPRERGMFDVRSFYNILVFHDSTPFPWKSIWRNRAPLRVVFFAWTVTLGKIFTIGNLRKQNVIMG